MSIKNPPELGFVKMKYVINVSAGTQKAAKVNHARNIAAGCQYVKREKIKIGMRGVKYIDTGRASV